MSKFININSFIEFSYIVIKKNQSKINMAIQSIVLYYRNFLLAQNFFF